MWLVWGLQLGSLGSNSTLTGLSTYLFCVITVILYMTGSGGINLLNIEVLQYRQMCKFRSNLNISFFTLS